MNKGPLGNAHEFIAAVILLAAICLVVDFRMAGKFEEYSRNHSKWTKDEAEYLKKHGETPLKTLERVAGEHRVLRQVFMIEHRLTDESFADYLRESKDALDKATSGDKK